LTGAAEAADAAENGTDREGILPEYLEIILFVAGYFVLMRWVLPRFGVST
jgi:hypothetical protein